MIPYYDTISIQFNSSILITIRILRSLRHGIRNKVYEYYEYAYKSNSNNLVQLREDNYIITIYGIQIQLI
jgi:hypothetical protein